MPEFIGSPWTGAIVAIGLLLVVIGLLLRYRALERRGTPLPPGVGGARMIGTTGVVLTDHVPGTRRGTVRVLGEEWTVADSVEEQLAVGDHVVVTEVTGTRLVVTTAPTSRGPEPTTDSTRSS